MFGLNYKSLVFILYCEKKSLLTTNFKYILFIKNKRKAKSFRVSFCFNFEQNLMYTRIIVTKYCYFYGDPYVIITMQRSKQSANFEVNADRGFKINASYKG